MEPPSANSDVESIWGFLEASSLEDRVLQPDKTLTIWLSCKPKGIGLHTSVVHFDVGDDRIERVVFLLAEDDVSQSLASNRPYSKVPRKKHFNVGEYVAGSRPTKATTQGFKYRLPQYAIPNNIRELVESKQIPEAITKGLTRSVTRSSLLGCVQDLSGCPCYKDLQCQVSKLDWLYSSSCVIGLVTQLDGYGKRWRSSSSEKSKVKVRRKLRGPRFCFQTRSDVDVLDDGYKWRKYGQKVVKNSLHPSIQETKIRSKRTQTSQSLKNENVMDDVTKAIREMSFEPDPERSSIIEK
ncbi:hypothetical protein HHK36_014657 [Tetracentron sinense]|uniref:WRKY domain-containing protein n=1 Tax=Tetracentron sinense TaxID=13715 RepID=A0A834Z5Y6_TETSI|nr:hypothetical protein HHK36_014657 [Tetracentron sinense]